VRYDCALLASHHVLCWGDDGFGQLGDGRTRDSARPVEVVGISTAVAISAGRLHACALLAGGAVKCWGRNAQGALGDGSQSDSSTPVTVRQITDGVAISAGQLEDATCALLAGGTVRCWGQNLYGELGDGTTASSDVPVGVTGIGDAVAISTSGQHACAVLASGGVACWGRNNHGQLGDGSHRNSATPVQVAGMPNAAMIAAAPFGYTCAVARSGSVYCWGHNPKNQLGDGLYPAGSAVPVRALGITNAVAVTAGKGHACALLAGGGADCWGYDDYGQLGDGVGPPAISNPVAVSFQASAAAVPVARVRRRATRKRLATGRPRKH
jgi:alpha-tubulin suppressor-like RCC1 family protein